MKTLNTKNVSMAFATAAFILYALVVSMGTPNDLSGHILGGSEIFAGVTNGGSQGSTGGG